MKRIVTICAAIVMAANLLAQAPNKMSYQAVIRNSSNVLVANQGVGMRVSILQGSASGTEVYKEIFNPNPQTNANGLVSIEIGSGVPLTGNFATIDWANGPYFIKTETDPTGGTSYSITGTSQLLSVPYALYAENSNAWQMKNDTAYTNHKVMINDNSVGKDLLLKVEGNYNPLISFNRTNATAPYIDREWWLYPTANGNFNIRDNTTGTNPLIIDTNGNIGIGINTPAEKLEVIGNVLLYGANTNNDTCSLKLYEDGVSGISLDYSGPQNRLDFVGSVVGTKTPLVSIQRTGNVGIGTTNPARVLHVNDVMRLEPRSSAPTSPAKGDIYFDGTLNKLRVYDGTTWQNCW